MALSMSRPWKHPKTGIYWLRKAVPDDLRLILGKREEKQTLAMPDPAEAKRLHAQALAELEVRWQSLRSGPRSLTELEAHELATAVHDRWLALHRDNPGEQTFWPVSLGDTLFPPAPSLWGPPGDLSLTTLAFDAVRRKQLEEWCCQRAEELLAARGLVVDEVSRSKLARAVAAATQRASVTLARYARGELDAGDYGVLASPQPISPPQAKPHLKPAVTFDEIVKGWAAVKQPSERTLYEWGQTVRQFTAYLGHDDAGRLTPDDLVAWKGALVESGLRAKTIRDAKLAANRAILQWAADNRRLTTNPAERIVIDVKSRAAESKRSFTDEEAAVVLRAALEEVDTPSSSMSFI